MSVVEDVRKVIQDFVAPELRSLSSQMTDVRRDIALQREDQKATEARLLRAIEQSKAEVLLVVENLELKQRLRQLESSVETRQQQSKQT